MSLKGQALFKYQLNPRHVVGGEQWKRHDRNLNSPRTGVTELHHSQRMRLPLLTFRTPNSLHKTTPLSHAQPLYRMNSVCHAGRPSRLQVLANVRISKSTRIASQCDCAPKSERVCKLTSVQSGMSDKSNLDADKGSVGPAAKGKTSSSSTLQHPTKKC